MFEMEMGLFILRVVLGLLFIGHGAQKLFGWFGGHGFSNTANWLGSLGLTPPKFWALIAGLAEFLGGVGLVLGLLTPIAAALIMGVMLMAIAKVHWAHGLWVANNGIEYPLVNLLISAFIGLFGPGLYAMDRWLSLAYPMPTLFFATLAIVILGVLVGLFMSRARAQPQAQGA